MIDIGTTLKHTIDFLTFSCLKIKIRLFLTDTLLCEKSIQIFSPSPPPLPSLLLISPTLSGQMTSADAATLPTMLVECVFVMRWKINYVYFLYFNYL